LNFTNFFISGVIKLKEITYKKALNEAIYEEMLRDEKVFVAGLDVGKYGGAFGVTEGLYEKFPDRIFNMPISEAGYTGMAVGAAMTGMRPIVELQISDWVTIASDQLVNNGANMPYLLMGKTSVPLVMRLPSGGYLSYACQHSHSWESWFCFVPGIKVVLPSTPYDAKGLLKSAIRDNNIVIFLEHKRLYNTTGMVPQEEYTVPIGKANIVKEGSDITIISYSFVLTKALEAAKILAGENIDAEVLDLRTVKPLDEETISNSLKKTGRAVIVQEVWKNCSVASEVSALISEKCFDYLDHPPVRITAKECPTPFSPVLENSVLPQTEDIVAEVKKLFAKK